MRKERKRWSAWATGEDGRWLSTVALKRQNVAQNSDRCSLITAACQHLQQRTVVVFEVDPGLVTFWQSQSFPEQNKSSISADLTPNHIHRCSNGTDLCLKIRFKWAAQQNSCSYSSRSLSSFSRDSGAEGQWCSLSSPPVIFKIHAFRTTLANRSESSSNHLHSQDYPVHLLTHHLRLSDR